VHSVTQVPYYLHLTLAQTLGLDSARIRVVKPFVGGGFGHRVEPLNFEMVAARWRVRPAAWCAGADARGGPS
jgi:4-hydroxybenzoyl-CoA reductase subunit alpha